jgi:2-aminoethylphosphonate dioxygenase
MDSRGWQAQYERDGVVVVHGLLDEARMSEIDGWLTELERLPETRESRVWKYHEGEGEARKLNRMEHFAWHDGLGGLLGGELREFAEAVSGHECALLKEKLNWKKPGGHGFEPHQDAQAGWEDFGTVHYNVAVVVDDATVENGCLEAAIGRHREGLLGPRFESMPADTVATFQWTPLPARRGSVVFFDSYLPHRSMPNRTATQRRILFATYNRLADGDHRDAYYAAKLQTHPPEAFKEQGKQYRGYKI